MRFTAEEPDVDACSGKSRCDILCDNSVAGPGVLAEHGLSLHIEADGRAFVFDTGASGVCVGNATRLGIDLSQAVPVVFSHGHYDHTGGMGALLSAWGGREVIGHPEVLAAKYSRQRSRPARAIGCPESRRRLSSLGATFRLSAEPQEIAPGVVTTGVIPRTTDFEHIPSHFAVRRGRSLARDSFDDEQAVVVRTRRGLVVIVGCAHRGLINTIRRAIELTGDGHVRDGNRRDAPGGRGPATDGEHYPRTPGFGGGPARGLPLHRVRSSRRAEIGFWRKLQPRRSRGELYSVRKERMHMRVAVSTDGNMVAAHFGRCEALHARGY